MTRNTARIYKKTTRRKPGSRKTTSKTRINEGVFTSVRN